MFFSKKPIISPQASAVSLSGEASCEAEEGTVKQITEMCHQAAQGDLEARIIGLNEHPKFGGLARATLGP